MVKERELSTEQSVTLISSLEQDIGAVIENNVKKFQEEHGIDGPTANQIHGHALLRLGATYIVKPMRIPTSLKDLLRAHLVQEFCQSLAIRSEQIRGFMLNVINTSKSKEEDDGKEA